MIRMLVPLWGNFEASFLRKHYRANETKREDIQVRGLGRGEALFKSGDMASEVFADDRS